jgi:type IV pilus assembly protein PilC
MLLKLPIVGDMICKVVVSRFCHTFATLMQSGVPILESLEIVQRSSGNRVIELLTEDLKASVRQGEGIAVTLIKTPVFPVMVTRMISIGEKSGQLDKMLTKVAEFYDEEMDAAMEGLTKIIEPLIIGFLGIVIGLIVIALFMPILNMASAVHY